MSADTTVEQEKISLSKGKVVKAFGNLLQVEFEGHIRQGEIAMVDVQGVDLKAEVIEIIGNEAKVQVYEDTTGIEYGTSVRFMGDLLEAELGPGLLTSILDGLQNPLENVADVAGFFLSRGVYIPALDRQRHWEYLPVAKIGDVLTRGDTLGTTIEERFKHHIMLPFSHFGKYKITWVIKPGTYSIDTVVAKAMDENGYEHQFTMVQKWPIKTSLFEGEKIKPSKMMDTGLRIIDTQFPLMKGGTFCSPGPFGAGKTVLQHHLSKFSSVDIVVLVACGERAGEVVEILREFPHLIDPHTDQTLMTRTVIICNTSSMPVAARESSIYMGITIAEYYRQMGLDILLLADSTSRWAQALREMSGRLEEIPGEEAFPAYLASRIADFYERSGAISLKNGKQGSVTIGGAVSPAGGNFEEPVTQATLAVVGAFLGLSRERSDSRRYPAIDPLISWSKYIDQVSQELDEECEGWGEMVQTAETILRKGYEIGKRMEVVGEEGTAIEDMVIFLKAELYDFAYLQQNAFDKEDAYSPLKRQIITFKLINKVFGKPFRFTTHYEARQYFNSLQNQIKNMNFMSTTSSHYRETFARIEQLIEKAN
ncbi:MULTISPECIES: V-type ATP synthase subunit A [unclassified Neochlamydia]|uniref:V-type ATP synthase subunit A n=1 Tax=unclassified Neochlamydia TaxID=2643326 RepID=UPI0014081A1F|nr:MULTISPECIES: V-type ATP synthase subunit A [unclassified Neochlamydia]MBS4166634.1 V-type ATP synthase alpha chain [Neochlamydia sp. AcF65]MBS4171335.1 V-type ATP synthase alpha chain [Neochlamydia sp. AcF95]NGY94790.1 V-type ATP synthase alpha chain [Neochlamydia sp. AcF84]